MLSTDFILLRRLRLKIDLIPGPPHHDKALYNPAIQVIARYPAAEVADAVTKLTHVELVTGGQNDPRAWQWVWREHDRRVRVGFTVMGSAAVATDLAWGGSSLDADCFVGDLLGFWAELRETHPDTWLHYDGRVYTERTFVDAIRDMIESWAVTDLVV